MDAKHFLPLHHTGRTGGQNEEYWTKPPAASYGRIFKFLVSKIGFLGSGNRFQGSKTEFEHSDRRASSWHTEYEGQLAYFHDQGMQIVM